MITNQIMKRNFMSSDISQRTKDGFFNATELLKVFNERTNQKKRFADFWENNNTKEFLLELSQDLNVDNSAHLKTHETQRGKGGATWMHPYLFVKLAMWLSPKVELQIIKWVYDNLIEFRVQAGVDYKDMCKSIHDNYLDFFKNNIIMAVKLYTAIVCVPQAVGNAFIKYRSINNRRNFRAFVEKKYPSWRFYTLYDKVTREKIGVVRR